MAKDLKYGMVGGSIYAFIGEVHRKAINFDTRAELVCGCFSNVPSENEDTARAYGIDPSRTYADYKEMAKAEAAREDGIDFVSICTPNFLHYEIAKEFLLAGIHVVCEKPLCFSVEEAQELEALAAAKDLVFAVTYGYTGNTMVKVAREMIAEGKIGRVVAVNAEYAQDWLLDELDEAHAGQDKNLSVWRTDPKISGISNCVGDIGTHMENMVHYLTGLKIKRISATVNKYGHALDLNANMLVEYENGVNGAYWCSQIAAGHYNGLVVRVFGDRGALEWRQEQPDYLYYTPKGQAMQVLTRGGNGIDQPAGGYSRLPVGHPEGLYVAFANIYRDYVTALIEKKAGRPYNTDSITMVDAGVDGVKFVHAVVESAEKDSAWVEL